MGKKGLIVMDIAFHYFAVKALAVLAGFCNDDAQVIAQNSQMVDDFDFTTYWNCTNVPDHIKNNPDYDLCIAMGLFNPAQTGFLCDGILGKTDYVNLVLPRFQRYTCAPFHFIPPEQSMIGKKEYRVAPATLGDGSIISQMLEQAKNEYRASADEAERHRKLMKIGVLLHIFADTVAHQMFSGFNANVNLVELENVTNNITGADETAAYNSSIQKTLKILKDWVPSITPAIGHMMIEHIPDLTHLSFTMEYTGGDGRKHHYTRSNTAEFLQMSRRILDFLCDCLGTPRFMEERWQNIRDVLREAFLTDISKLDGQRQTVEYLKTAWAAPHGCTYDYDGEALKKAFAQEAAAVRTIASANVDGLEKIDLDHRLSAADMKLLGMDVGAEEVSPSPNAILSTKASADFYNYNVIADEILIALYGPHPRKL